jgi:hypothetical protein
MPYVLHMARYTETIFPIKKVLAMTEDLAARVSEFRHKHRISSENEAIRQLIELGLKAAEKKAA